jgi:hypothetical protein
MTAGEYDPMINLPPTVSQGEQWVDTTTYETAGTSSKVLAFTALCVALLAAALAVGALIVASAVAQDRQDAGFHPAICRYTGHTIPAGY